jgi:hypothetical protein
MNDDQHVDLDERDGEEVGEARDGAGDERRAADEDAGPQRKDRKVRVLQYTRSDLMI